MTFDQRTDAAELQPDELEQDRRVDLGVDVVRAPAVNGGADLVGLLVDFLDRRRHSGAK